MVRQVKNRIKEKGPAQKLRIRAGGQVVLMVLLASALILTLGLSASRVTTTETKIDADQEMLKKAFNTAESAIDYYLATGTTGIDAYKNESVGISESADLSVEDVGGNVRVLSFSKTSQIGQIEYFWLVNHNSDGSLGTEYLSKISGVGETLTVCGANRIQVKLDYFYIDKNGNYQVSRSVKTDTDDSNKCIPFDMDSNGGKKSILLTVMPMNQSGVISVRSKRNFPVQGKRIWSTGKVNGVNNTVSVLNTYEVPAFFTEGLISGGGIISGGDGTK